MTIIKPIAGQISDPPPQRSTVSYGTDWDDIFDPNVITQLANRLYKKGNPHTDLEETSSTGSKEHTTVPDESTSGIASVVQSENIISKEQMEQSKLNPSPNINDTKPAMPTIPKTVINQEYYFLPAFKTETDAKSVELSPNKSIEVQAIRKDFPILRQQINSKPLIWFDNAATTQKPQAVMDTLDQYYSEYNSNIHRATHTLAKRATTTYEAAREKMQRFIGAANPEEIIFLRGTTEAINLVAQSYGRMNIHPGDEIILSQMEHHSNIVPWQMLRQDKGAVIKVIPINDNGEVLLDEYEKLFTPRTRMVAITHVSNVLGSINPLRTMIEIAHYHNACVLVDGAQSAPHFKVDVKDLDADFYTFSGHKVYGPTGIGVLFGKKALLEAMPPWQGGGGMIKQVTFEKTLYNNLPYKFEAGTGNIADAIGLGAATDYIQKIGLANIERHERSLTNYAMKALSTLPGLCFIGTAPNKISVISFIVRGFTPDELAHHLDQAGIAVRTGHHCAQPALERYGVTDVLRVSLGLYNTREEVDTMVKVLSKIIPKKH